MIIAKQNVAPFPLSPMPPEVIEILSADEVRRTVNRLASEIIEQTDDLSKLVLLGIYT
jgi:pyrimidine operon attenuation protein / uracil phosphoribosyltransferase